MDPLRNARRFAAGFPAVFLPVFALPLLLKPYAWARAFGWKQEPETDVGLYFSAAAWVRWQPQRACRA